MFGRKRIKEVQEMTFFLCLKAEHSKGWVKGWKQCVEYGKLMEKANQLLKEIGE